MKSMEEMQKKLSVSVVMATYNGEKYLREQLDSIRKQTNKPDEVIIADDASTDSTVALVHNYIKEFQLSDNWKIFVNNHNKGYAKNFIDLVSYASCEIVFFCDQDDIWMPDKIELMAQQMINHPDINLMCSDLELLYVDINAQKWRKKDLETMSDSRMLEIISISKRNFHCQRSGCLMAIRKNYFNDVKDFWRAGWAHDDFFWKMAVCSDSCAIYHMKSIKRRLHGNNATNVKIRTRKGRINQINLLELQYNSLSKYIDSQAFKDSGLKRQILNKNIESLSIRRNAIINRSLFSWIKLVVFYRDCYPWVKALLLDGYFVFFEKHKASE